MQEIATPGEEDKEDLEAVKPDEPKPVSKDSLEHSLTHLPKDPK